MVKREDIPATPQKGFKSTLMKKLLEAGMKAGTAAAENFIETQTPKAINWLFSQPSPLYSPMSIGSNKPRSIGRKPRGGVSTGYFRGRFTKPSRRGKKTIFDKYSKYGGILSTEIRGGITDPDVCYIGHSTFRAEQIATAAALAVCRKLFVKAGIDVPVNPEESIVVGNPTFATGSGIMLVWKILRADGTTDVGSYYPGNNTSVALITFANNFASQILLMMNTSRLSQQVATEVLIPEVWLQYQGGATEGTNPAKLILSRINLETEVLHILVESEMVVQNRTKSDVGLSEETDVVDNVPLKGYCYEFIGGVPQSKESRLVGQLTTVARALNRTDWTTGMISVRGAQLTGSLKNYREPPDSKVFNNCSKASKVTLEPGHIKKSTLVSTWRGYFTNLFKYKLIYVRGQDIPGVNFQNVKAPGKARLFALEERLNTGNTNPIVVNFENQVKVGCYLQSTKKFNMLTLHTDDVVFENTL